MQTLVSAGKLLILKYKLQSKGNLYKIEWNRLSGEKLDHFYWEIVKYGKKL